jgi:CNT family concentrative nucleoside transporter
VKTLSEVALRALIAATLACLMTACIAGAFYNKGIILFSAVL